MTSQRKHPTLTKLAIIVLLLATTTPVGAETWLLRAGKIHTMTGKTLEPGAVLITDGKIVEVAQSIESKDGMRVAQVKVSPAPEREPKAQ